MAAFSTGSTRCWRRCPPLRCWPRPSCDDAAARKPPRRDGLDRRLDARRDRPASRPLRRRSRSRRTGNGKSWPCSASGIARASPRCSMSTPRACWSGPWPDAAADPRRRRGGGPPRCRDDGRGRHRAGGDRRGGRAHAHAGGRARRQAHPPREQGSAGDRRRRVHGGRRRRRGDAAADRQRAQCDLPVPAGGTCAGPGARGRAAHPAHRIRRTVPHATARRPCRT